MAVLLLSAVSATWASETSPDLQVKTPVETPPTESPTPTPVEAPSTDLETPAPAKSASELSQVSTPISISFDVAPGYRNSVYLGLPEGGTFDLSIKNLQLNPSKKWKPTAYVALVSDQCDVWYFLNLSVDTDLNKSYARIRLIDAKQKKELLNLTHQKLYELDHEFRVSGKLEGKFIHMFVDNELVDERELTCEPAQIELGASSGKFVASIIEPQLPPAPE